VSHLAALPVRILLVAADPSLVGHLVALVSGAGPFHVKTQSAGTIAEAIARVHEAQFDVALLDLRLPDSAGVATAVRFGAEAPEVPFIVLTDDDDDDLAVEALHGGAQDVVVKKPSSDALLMRAIHYAIERHALLAQLKQSLADARTSEQRGEDLKTRLIHADRFAAVGQLAASVAHEINNPAAFILANETMIRESADRIGAAVSSIRKEAERGAGAPWAGAILGILGAADVDDNLKAIREMVDDNTAGMVRIRTIVGDLRTFARPDAEEIEPVDLAEIIDVACSMVASEVRPRARLIKEVPPLPPIVGDRGRLAQVLVHLLVNATQAIEPGGADRNFIRISAREDQGKIILSIEDSGAGMTDDVRARAFEPFFTTRLRDVGRGLGLSVSADIVHKHGGEIRVESERGHGARFDIVLPIPRRQATPVPAEEPTPEAAPTSVSVLVVDDEPTLLTAYRRMLRPPHEVVAVEGGVEGLALLARRSFDAIVCDLMMPEFDGPRFYEALRETAPAMLDRVIFCTGGAVTRRAREFVEGTPNLFLEKPVSRRRLLSAIEEVCAKERAGPRSTE